MDEAGRWTGARPWIVAGVAVVSLLLVVAVLVVVALVPLRSDASATEVDLGGTWSMDDADGGLCMDAVVDATLAGVAASPLLAGTGVRAWHDVAVTGLTVDAALPCGPAEEGTATRVFVSLASPACDDAFVGAPWNVLIGAQGPTSVEGCGGAALYAQAWSSDLGVDALAPVDWEVPSGESCVDLSVAFQVLTVDGDRWVAAGEGVRSVCLSG